jgi:hypothetical protein
MKIGDDDGMGGIHEIKTKIKYKNKDTATVVR